MSGIETSLAPKYSFGIDEQQDGLIIVTQLQNPTSGGKMKLHTHGVCNIIKTVKFLSLSIRITLTLPFTSSDLSGLHT